jgi:hypothetical protein
MIIQDLNHIEAAQEEIVGARGNKVAFSTTNLFNTSIKNRVDLGGANSATAGAGAEAISDFSLLTYAKADTRTVSRDGVSGAISTSASAIQYH